MIVAMVATYWRRCAASWSNGSLETGGVHDIGSARRRRAQVIPPCNQVIEFLTVSQVSQMLTDITMREGPNALRALLASFSQSELRYNVQVLRICASCDDVSSTSPAFEEFCGPDDFGSDVPFSGLLMIPIDENGIRPAGTLKGMLYMHGTSTSEVPSIQWRGAETDSTIQIQLGVASAGTAVIFPDYMGYAESATSTFKSYMVRKSYETSIIPLWLYTQEFLRDETDCQTALGEAVYILGYDEGGYASVVAADALHRMGVNVVAVFSGGAPFQIGSQAFLRIIQGTDAGTFPLDKRELLALLGSGYSSTYPDLANYRTGQDVLAESTRDGLVELVREGVSLEELRMAIPEIDPLSIYDSRYLSFARLAINEQNFDPCSGDDLDAEGIGFLCRALQDNDLTETLITATFPITICHSPMDELISFKNVPDVTRNSFLSYVPATGNHAEAEEYCILTGSIFSFSGVFQTYIPAPAHFVDGCPPPTSAPTDLPSPIQSNAPSTVPTVPIPSMTPSVIPSPVPSTILSVVPSSVPPIAPSAGSEVPSQEPSLFPSSLPVQSCGVRNAPCSVATDCCSGRCTLNVCQTAVSTRKTSLAKGFGGAGGGPTRGSGNGRRRVRGL